MSRPRVLFVSRERLRLPLEGAQRRKWDAVSAVVEPRVLAAAPPGLPTRDGPFHLEGPRRPRILDGVLHYLLLPFSIARELREFRPEAALVQGIHETVAFLVARRLSRSRAKVILDVQGDWHHATRLYGSPLRRLLSPVNDALGPLAVRRADGVRTISTDTTALVRAYGVEPLACFPPYVDLEAFLSRPPAALPAVPAAVFVGALERIKAFDSLAAAWPLVARRLPSARLTIVGHGRLAPLAQQLVASFPGLVEWQPLLAADGVAAALDDSWLLVLPSRSEGLGRVLVEAACRGRALVGTARGGIPDIVRPGENGVLVETDDPGTLAEAILGILSDRSSAERLGAGARRTGEAWGVGAAVYADRVAELVAACLRGERRAH